MIPQPSVLSQGTEKVNCQLVTTNIQHQQNVESWQGTIVPLRCIHHLVCELSDASKMSLMVLGSGAWRILVYPGETSPPTTGSGTIAIRIQNT
jgi:hypothetical protein